MGDTETAWCPWTYLQEQHPDVYLYVQHLRGGVRSCVDVRRRAIWLDSGQSQLAMRCALTYEIAILERGLMPADPRAAAQVQREAAEWACRKMIPADALVFACHGALDTRHVAERLGVTVGTLRGRWRCMTDEEQDEVVAALRSPSAVL